MTKSAKIIIICLIAALSILLLWRWTDSTVLEGNNELDIAVVTDITKNNIEVRDLEYLNQCIREYTKSKPGTIVNIEIIPYDQYSEWLFSNFLYNKEPDIFSVLPKDFEMLSSLNMLESLNAGGFTQNIDPAITGAWTRNGTLYAVPFKTSPPCLLVNNGLIQTKYINLYNNYFDWMDFYYACKFFTSDTDADGIKDIFGVTNMNWKTAVYSNGQQLFDYANKKTFFNDSEVEYAIKYAISMNKLTLDNYVSSFEDGRAVIKVSNLAEARYYIANYPSLDLSILPIPKGPDGAFYSEPYDVPLAISQNSPNKELAQDFLSYIVLNEENQKSLFEDSLSFPVLKKVQNDPYVQINMQNYISPESFDILLTKIKTVNVNFAEYYDLMDYADKEISQFINNELDIEAELDSLNLVMTDKLKNTVNNQ